MGDLNSQINNIVWMDIPVVELDRAIAFYAKVLKRAVY
jgi:predicted enzyme related to lactoylglutathione lyase